MNKAIVLAGPTAVGKTEYAIKVAKALNAEIVSCDSMQLYKYMDVGSAKPTKEELSQVKHYLVDQFDPREPFSVSKYQEEALKAMAEICAKGKIPLITGGTGLYLNSLIYSMDFAGVSYDKDLRDSLYLEATEKGNEYLHDMLKELDPLAAARIHPNNVKKVIRAIEGAKSGSSIKDFNLLEEENPDYEFILVCLTRDRQELYSRINERVDKLIDLGLVDEVKRLMDMGLDEGDISMKGIGYKEIISYLKGEITLDEAVEKVKTNTRHYAKRQITWFKRYEDMKWFNLSEEADPEEIIKWLKRKL
ncbi:MAG: tRNA (adenosine(37)-N6)-dimethylallyltransferase MiaA [Clostridia bacterium]|nr:tRNA (adenosine(37)-N6)-dimethylallyltransferase MiaA [Clostridia bacterium]